MTRSYLARFAFISMVLISLSGGCGGGTKPGENARVTKSNMDKLKPGMSVDEVETILGTGETVLNGSAKVNGQRVPDEERTWRNGNRVITVSFVDGKVVYSTGLNL